MLNHLDIADCFNDTFSCLEHTRMTGGAEEPLYLPGLLGGWSLIRYRADFAQSALHEASHWCLAGQRRRTMPDYGYWYVAAPRSANQQARFFEVEVRTQALEWLFAEVAGIDFQPSADDPTIRLSSFRKSLVCEREKLMPDLPSRAAIFIEALHQKKACKESRENRRMLQQASNGYR